MGWRQVDWVWVYLYNTLIQISGLGWQRCVQRTVCQCQRKRRKTTTGCFLCERYKKGIHKSLSERKSFIQDLKSWEWFQWESCELLEKANNTVIVQMFWMYKICQTGNRWKMPTFFQSMFMYMFVCVSMFRGRYYKSQRSFIWVIVDQKINDVAVVDWWLNV